MGILTIAILVLISIAAIVVLTSRTKLNPFASLFIVALLLAVAALPKSNVIEILKIGFGNTIASIGFLIIFGAVIAVVMEKSNAAQSIANYILNRTGEKKAAKALGITGYLVGLPIFCDSGYIILSGLVEPFSKRAGVAAPMIAFVLATSLYAVHCLTPTHPGALAAAEILQADIGMLILLGALFAIPAAVAAYFWIQFRTQNIIFEENKNSDPATANDESLPPLSLSLLPIVAPLMLITLASLLSLLNLAADNIVFSFVAFIGQPIMALFIGAALSLLLLHNKSVTAINQVIAAAIEKAGPILIITGAGGMFGMVIKETEVGAYFGNILLNAGLGLAVPFLISAILKTAQGSSTVAVITAASLLAPMLNTLGLDTEVGKIFTALALGAGSMLVSHANDSYFWVISRFSNINPGITLKIYSSATFVMGATVFLFIWFTSIIVF